MKNKAWHFYPTRLCVERWEIPTLRARYGSGLFAYYSRRVQSCRNNIGRGIRTRQHLPNSVIRSIYKEILVSSALDRGRASAFDTATWVINSMPRRRGPQCVLPPSSSMFMMLSSLVIKASQGISLVEQQASCRCCSLTILVFEETAPCTVQVSFSPTTLLA